MFQRSVKKGVVSQLRPRRYVRRKKGRGKERGIFRPTEKPTVGRRNERKKNSTASATQKENDRSPTFKVVGREKG